MDTNMRDDLLQAIPLLRQYAFCLTGSRDEGDALIESGLLEFLDEGAHTLTSGAHTSPVVAYFKAFHDTRVLARRMRRPLGVSSATPGGDMLVSRLMALEPMQRQALLLAKTLGFSYEDTARILGIGVADVEECMLSAVAALLNGSGRSALIIEDDIFVAGELDRILVEMGFVDTETVSRYEDAMDAASARRPDLILADIQLRDSRSGVDTVRDIRGLYNAPVVYVTAYPELAERLPPQLRGGIVRKPFESVIVVKTVKETLTRLHT